MVIVGRKWFYILKRPIIIGYFASRVLNTLMLRFRSIDVTTLWGYWPSVWGYIGTVTLVLVRCPEGQWWKKCSYISSCCRYVQFLTLRDAQNQTMTSILTIITPMENIYYILLDGQLPAATWRRVGGSFSGLPMAMTMIPIDDGVHYVATAELESAFTAWLTLIGSSNTAAMSLGNAGKRKPKCIQLDFGILTMMITLVLLQ